MTSSGFHLETTMRCGFLLFPDVTQLDLTGPYEIFPRAPGIKVLIVARDRQPVKTQWGMQLMPDVDFAHCPPLDVLVIPGGFGIQQAMLDAATIEFIRTQADGARYVVSICTGALLLGAAGLLQGKRATTHWAYHDLLATLGATPVQARVVRDGNLFTGGGVTAGIDVALTVIAEVLGAEAAQTVQLGVEYSPDPPFDAGRPEGAPAAIHARLVERYAAPVAGTADVLRQAVARLPTSVPMLRVDRGATSQPEGRS